MERLFPKVTPRRDDLDDDDLFTLPESDRRTLRKMYVDLYMGKDADNPSITTRLDRQERSLELLFKVLITATVLSVTALLGTVGQIAVKVIH